MTSVLLIAVVALFLGTASAVDLKVLTFKCDETLPVQLSNFSMTCDGGSSQCTLEDEVIVRGLCK
jgi:hypothetical protein